jgi:hypothetical protein
MKKKGKTSPTPTIGKKKGNRVVSTRKNTNASTRNAGRQRSGNNGPQQGSH